MVSALRAPLNEESPGRVHSEKVLVLFSCCPPFTGPHSVRSTDSWNLLYWLSVLRSVSENDCSVSAEDTVSATLLKRHMSFTFTFLRSVFKHVLFSSSVTKDPFAHVK